MIPTNRSQTRLRSSWQMRFVWREWRRRPTLRLADGSNRIRSLVEHGCLQSCLANRSRRHLQQPSSVAGGVPLVSMDSKPSEHGSLFTLHSESASELLSTRARPLYAG